MKYFKIFLVCLALFVTKSLFSAEITDIRLSSFQPKVVRLAVDLTENTDAEVFRLKNPSRLVVDFKKTTVSMKNKEIVGAGFISGIRLGQPEKQVTRLVLDLPVQELRENHFFLPPQAGKSWRFVLDLTSMAEYKPVQTDKKNYSKKLQPFQPQKKKQKIVVLDPGHGGQDPGAISRSGRYEKHLTLLLAYETKTLLEKKGFRVVLTRSTDVAIPLRERFEKAHKAEGDLFVSIHADSAKNKNAKGLSIYTISERASDAEASALAERENKADIILGMDLGNYQQSIGNILIDLAKRDTMDKSAQYAKLVVEEMKKRVRLVPNAHRFAGFVVLKSPNIPSVLLEMGYLSNKEEEKLLQKKAYRKELAEALTNAVVRYFNQLEEN